MGVIWENHDAVVTNSDDDEQRGRIRCSCPALLGDEDAELPMWVSPVLDWGVFIVPNVGEIVELQVAVASDEDESYGQMSIDNLDVRWRGKRHYTDDEVENDNTPTPIHPSFKENYGRRRGFSTPHGHVFLFDDDPKNPTVKMIFQKSALEVGATPEDSEISKLEFEKDGSFRIALLENTTMHLQTVGKKFVMAIDGGAALEISEKDSNTVTKLGDAAVSAAIAESLQTYIDDQIKTYLDAHVHPDAMGGTGAPSTQMPAYSSDITSSKLKFPDG